MNPVRENWNQLCDSCALVGLPKPEMFPANLGDKMQVAIPGITFYSTETADAAIRKAIIWVAGYRHCQQNQRGNNEHSEAVG